MAESQQMSQVSGNRGKFGTINDMDDETTYLTLRALSNSESPVGCWRVRAALRAAGIEMSEATAGRLLRELDFQSLTQRMGSKGRLLTEDGRSRLATLEQARARSSYHSDLLQAIKAETIEDILDVLRARRAVEAECAGLAAMLATDVEIHEIEQAVQSHLAEVERGGIAGDQNRTVHRLVAQASKSRVLLAVVNLILEDQQLQEAQARIQRAANQVVPQEHVVLLRAIKSRRPDRASKAMRAHIDRLIRVVQDYGLHPLAVPEAGGEADNTG